MDSVLQDTGITISPALTDQLKMSPIGLKQSTGTVSPNQIGVTAQPSPTSAAKRLRPGYSKKLCVKIEEDMHKQDYNLQMMQEEMYGIDSGDPRELNVVYDVHNEEADK